jgi:hypothetical protein
MGHDISSYRFKINEDFDPELHEGDGVELTNEISYLRFAAWNQVGQFLFYNSLNANEFNMGCSGSGNYKIFTIEEIKAAKAKLKYIATGEEELSAQLAAYSLDERHSFFEMVVKSFGGSVGDKLSELNQREVNEEVEKINEFYNKIIAKKYKKIAIFFG